MLWLLIGGCRIPSSVLNVSRFVFGGTSTSIHVSFLFLFSTGVGMSSFVLSRVLFYLSIGLIKVLEVLVIVDG